MLTRKKRVFITGVNSFTGRYLEAELTRNGWDVWGTCQCSSLVNNQYKPLDLMDANGMRDFLQEVQPEAVIHLAAISYVVQDNISRIYEVNLVGSRNLLSAIDQAGVTPNMVLLASSAQVYGNSQSGVLSELSPVAPANDYAISKLAMEHLSNLWGNKFPIVITRPFNYTGVGQAEIFLIPKVVAHFARKEKVIELGNLDVYRDFSDVRMVAAAYKSLVESPNAAGQIVNVCSGITYSLRDIISMAESISGHKLEIRVNPTFVRRNEVNSLSGSVDKLRSILGTWSPLTIDDTLRWMLDSYS